MHTQANGFDAAPTSRSYRIHCKLQTVPHFGYKNTKQFVLMCFQNYLARKTIGVSTPLNLLGILMLQYWLILMR
jgi:hypothetical protein